MVRHKKGWVAPESEEKIDEPVEETLEDEPTPESTESVELSEPEESSSTDEQPQEEPLKQSVDVHGKDGKFIRTYCFEIHGQKYAELAKQFAQKISGHIS